METDFNFFLGMKQTFLSEFKIKFYALHLYKNY